MAMVQNPVLKRPDRPAGALRLLVLALGAIGASSAFSQTVTVTPSVQSRLTWTDNVGASSDKESDWIAEISPGITVSRKSGRFSGLLRA
ncbi:MAG: TIGR03016 family PEP-CTERM system-associated outer membrane protein, partial [Azoarcus sp.]|nr:TIGR03016 family PEP-CTERM system-associated outer membrane protein [Azoarcus sp.]